MLLLHIASRGASPSLSLLFSGRDTPALFAQFFSTAFVTLFHITAGDPWPEDPQLYEENGLVIWRVAIFHMAYEISVGWVILQVRVVDLAPTRPRRACCFGFDEKYRNVHFKFVVLSLIANALRISITSPRKHIVSEQRMLFIPIETPRFPFSFKNFRVFH